MKKIKKKDHFQEFSKIILAAFAIFYFLGGLFLSWVMWYQITHAISVEYVSSAEFVTYFTAPMVAGLLSYFGKALGENFQKIKNNLIDKFSDKTSTDKIAKG